MSAILADSPDFPPPRRSRPIGTLFAIRMGVMAVIAASVI